MIPIATLENLPPQLIQVILWELYEIRFPYKLCALDCVLVPHLWADHYYKCCGLLECIFPGTAGLMMWKEPLLTKQGDLGFTDMCPDNIGILQSFCLLLSTWPNTHPSFSSYSVSRHTSNNVAAYEILSRACLFYVQTFHDHFGRPLLVPHAYPFDYHHDLE